MKTKEPKAPMKQKTITTLKHDEASRKNIPTAEYQSVMRNDEQAPIRVAYERRNADLDPQLIWRGKRRYPLTLPLLLCEDARRTRRR
jgi:adenine-specific DNA-methyltransferase